MVRPRQLVVVAFVAAALATLVMVAPACGTDPVGVESCRKIEKVRCESAIACGISLSGLKSSENTPESHTAACERYYDDACLHGLAVSTDPGSIAVNACVNAIINGDCGIVENPQNYEPCAFLSPTPLDASVDADATD